jgi:hypothetical protein
MERLLQDDRAMNKPDQRREVVVEEPVETEVPAVGADPAMWNAGMGAASGALAGAAGGPVCAIMGAAVGAFAGGIGMTETEENPSRTEGGSGDPG